MAYTNAEFEFIALGDITAHEVGVVNDVRLKVLDITLTSKNIIAYQNWSSDTPKLNNKKRNVFSLKLSDFYNATRSYSDYKPTVVISDNSIGRYFLFTVENISYDSCFPNVTVVPKPS